MSGNLTKEKLIHLSLIAGFAALFYLNSFGNLFVWNDWPLIIENFLLKDRTNLPEIFAGAFWKPLIGEPFQIYRPLALVSFMSDLALWRLEPWGYHLVNILLHLLNSALAYFLLGFYVPPTTALIASTLFASHPIHTGVVTYISGRAELLMAFFLLGGMLSFLQSQKCQSRLLYLLSLPLFFLALLAKETAAIFPLLVVVLEFTAISRLPRDGRWGRLMRHLGPLVTLALYFTFRAVYVGRSGSGYPSDFLNFFKPLLWALESMPLYIGSLLFPWKLHFFYLPELREPFLDYRLWLSLLVLAGGGWGLFRASRSGNAAVVFSLLWLLIHLLPLFYIAAFARSFLGGWLYLPSLGIFLLAALAFSRAGFLRTHRLYLWGGLLIAALLGALTFNRNWQWKNDLEISLYASAVSPQDPVALRLLGHAYFRRGQTAAAEKAFHRAIALSPADPRIHESLGRLYSFLGRGAEALASYQRMRELSPQDPYTYWRIARFYLEKRDFAEAEKYFAEAAGRFPYSSELRNDLAQVYYIQGKFDEARSELEAALRIAPRSSVLRDNLERALRGSRSGRK